MPRHTAIGLDIGTTSVRAAEVSLSRGSVTLERFGQVPLPAGAVHDGEVMDPAAVTAALRSLWSKVRFRSKRVVLGVANQRVVVRQVELPWLAESELRESLPLLVADLVPMPVDQAVLDFVTLAEGTDQAGARIRTGLLVAVAADMVATSVEAVIAAGLSPTGVDLTSFAVLRAVSGADHLGLQSRPEVIVDIGADVTNIVIHEGGVPRFVRILLMGGDDVTEALVERMGMGYSDGEQWKRSLGLAEPPPDDLDAVAVSRTMSAAAHSLIDEIRGSLSYYLATTGSGPLDRVLVSGGGALLPGLREALAQVVNAPVEQAGLFAHLKLGRTGLDADQLGFVEPLAVVPVGLALGAAS
ncbi:MAG: type IV pilus assembly protein PilM [Actinomycetota bacterium]|nr:MAG: type IV pilus assembly protein PilM [Actinomycetota bacterium]